MRRRDLAQGMADTPPPVPDDLKDQLADFVSKKTKPKKITKNLSDSELTEQQALWVGRAVYHVQLKGRYDLYSQIAQPDMQKIVKYHITCGGAHNIGAECECGFGHCVGCGDWIPNTAGWGVRCNKARCTQNAPSNVGVMPIVPPPAIVPVAPATPIAPAAAPVAPASAPAVAQTKTPRKVAIKKAGGKKKRAKSLGLGGTWGGWTSDDESDGGQAAACVPSSPTYSPTTPTGSPPPTAGLWVPAPPPAATPSSGASVPVPSASSGVLVPIPPPAMPSAAPPTGCGFHDANDICNKCGVNFCGGCNQAKSPSRPFNTIPNYNCGCTALANTVDLTVQPDEPVVPIPTRAGLPSDYPEHWPPPPHGVNPFTARLDELLPGSAEFKSVARHFHDRNVLGGALYKLHQANEAGYIGHTLLNTPTAFKILKIVAVRNLGKERSYDGFLQELMARRGMEQADAEEVVFHGTNYVHALSILKDGFLREMTGTTAFGHGSYHDPYGPVSQYHALDKSRHDAPACIVVSKIASGLVGLTKESDMTLPSYCDCGASGADKAAWMRISFRDPQVCPQHLLFFERT